MNNEISTADDLQPTGTISFSMAGKTPKNEDDVVRVAQMLVEQMNKDGSRWGSVRALTQRCPIDCEASDQDDPRRKLSMQVTRVMPECTFCELGATGHCSGEATADQLVEDLLLSIKGKQGKYGGPMNDIVLVLDAHKAARYAFPPVVEELRRKYRSHTFGFKEIWVVGPDAGSVQRLWP